jgi:hypothetical protein
MTHSQLIALTIIAILIVGQLIYFLIGIANSTKKLLLTCGLLITTAIITACFLI